MFKLVKSRALKAYGHFGPKTLRYQTHGAEVSQFFALVPKCLPELKDAVTVQFSWATIDLWLIQ